MSRVYLVRHGQAGTRQDYDTLSEVGFEQARRLGVHFARQGLRFHAAWSGSLKRQRQTAEAVRGVYGAECVEFPDTVVDEAWNEFDLDHVYRTLAPILCEEDEEFRRDYEAMHAEGDIDRRWTNADVRMVQAWIKGHPRFTGETWLEFHARVASRREALAAVSEESDSHNIVVFTSGTPIGIWAALGLDVEDHRAMRLAGVLHNTSYTVIRLRPKQLRLHMFNGVPHLDGELLTYR